jgi:WNK lysine deficient protein kinase
VIENDDPEEEEEEETKFVEWDPTGRFGRTTQLFGRGTYKNVYKAFDEEEGMDVAWNQVKVSGLPPEEKQRLMHEVEILKKLDHKNILKFYHSWNVMEKGEMSVNFITEACEGTLNKYAAKFKTNLDMRAVKSWSRQILRGLEYLHLHDPPIVHRDLKCDNIFVNGNAGEIKIGDLGLAAMLNHQRTHSVIGTPEFMAPELYEEDYDERVDIYSFGMCLIELVTFKCPYSECKNPAQIYKRVSQGILPEALEAVKEKGDAIYNFILKCIAPKEERWTASELLADPFLEKKQSRPRNLPRAVTEEEPEAPRPQVAEEESSELNRSSFDLTNPPPVLTGSDPVSVGGGEKKGKGLYPIQEASKELPATPGGRFYRVVSNTEGSSELPAGHFEQRERGASLNIRVKGLMMDNNTLRLRLRITDQSSGQTRTVEFPFSTNTDSAHNVAREMVEELQLSESDVNTIEREINKEVKYLSEERPNLESSEQHSSRDSFEEMRSTNGFGDGGSSEHLASGAGSTTGLTRVDSAKSVESQDRESQYHQHSAGGSPDEIQERERSPQKSPIVVSAELRQEPYARAASPSIVVGRSKTQDDGSSVQQLGLDVKSMSLASDERVERSHSAGPGLAQQQFKAREPSHQFSGDHRGNDSSASASQLSSPLASPPVGAINNSNYPQQVPADVLSNASISLPPKHPQSQQQAMAQQQQQQQQHQQQHGYDASAAAYPSRSETPVLAALEDGDLEYEDEMELQVLEELEKMQQQEEAEMRHRHATERQSKVRAFHKRRLERSLSRLALGSNHQSDGNLTQLAATQQLHQQQYAQQLQQSQMTQTAHSSASLSALYQPVQFQQQQQQQQQYAQQQFSAGIESAKPPLAPSQGYVSNQPLVNGHLQSAAAVSISYGSDVGTSSIGTMSRESSKASMSSDNRDEAGDSGKAQLTGEQLKEAKEKKKRAALEKMNALTGSCLTGLDVKKNSEKASQVALKDEAKLMEKMQKAADSVSLSGES